MAQTILVVEDEDTLRDELSYQLEQEGYSVVSAADGGEALSRFRSTKPDLILLDLMLPVMSGVEVTRVIRRESNVPILILTARDSEVDKVVGLELGADDYVTKPFSLRELQARIRGILRRTDRPAEPNDGDGSADQATIGRATVDLAGHRLLRDGEVRPIKPKAFDLLSFLLRHQGQVFSREQLLADVWGYDYAGETRTVDVHVHWLRAEIEEDPQNPKVLETVRGVGYVLRRPT
ncbi:MAG TPA: response regulator transcription factor [Candidatus Limnocylindrales bacterium]